MKPNLTTLGKVFDRVDAMSANCFDQNIAVPDISFDNLDIVRIAGEPHSLRPVAQRSISNRLGIPYPYLTRCPSDVQAMNLNHWIKHEKNDQLLFRFDGEAVRAVFTTKYIPADNFEVMERLDSLGYKPETPVQCHLDTEFMSLSIAWPASMPQSAFLSLWDLKLMNSHPTQAFLSIRKRHSQLGRSPTVFLD